MFKKSLLSLGLLLVTALNACSTSISNIRQDPADYNGKTLGLSGEVTEAFAIPLTGSMIYLLYDRTGTIPVFSAHDREPGDKVSLQAKVVALETDGAVDDVDEVADNITDYLRENDLIQGRLVDLGATGISSVVKLVLRKTQGSYFLIEESE